MLHDSEKRIMQLMMKSMKAIELEELDIELIEGGEKKKFYRLYVDNLRLAYEFLFMARMTGW